MIEYIALGALQGIFEWLPISSKTAVMLLSHLALGSDLVSSYSLGLSLQLGTVISAILYFRREILSLHKEPQLLSFLAIATIITAIIGGALYFASKRLLAEAPSEAPTIAIGALLVAQALAPRGEGSRREARLRDAAILGIAQGLAALPGVSRSGITILALLAAGYKLDAAMRLSFLASIPANAGAAILVAASGDVSAGGHELLVSLASSALVGLIAVGVLIRLAASYGRYMTLLMGIATLAAGLLAMML